MLKPLLSSQTTYKGIKDNELSSAAIRKFCDDSNIRLDTSVAKNEHISNGNKLGIIDRLVRTSREIIEYFEITGHSTDNIKNEYLKRKKH